MAAVLSSLRPGAFHAQLAAAHAAGRLRYGDLGLEPQRHAERTLALAARRLTAWHLPADAPDLDAQLRRMVAADVYLTLACDEGTAAAWERFTTEYRMRLTGLAVSRGADPATAEAAVGDLLADLALPPPNGSCRTLIGTFDGAGSLFGWLAVILGRRLARAHRTTGPGPVVSLTPAPNGDTAAVPEPVGRSPGPEQRAAAAEAGGRLAALLAQTWSALTAGEALALVAKYRDGWEQREIARLLGVSDSRVSRVVARAHDKLARAARRCFAGDGPPDGATWEALSTSLRIHLSNLAPVGPPSGGGRTPIAPGDAP